MRKSAKEILSCVSLCYICSAVMSFPSATRLSTAFINVSDTVDPLQSYR